MHVKFLETLDWSILIAYFLILIAIGIWASSKRKKGSSLFLAENSLRWYHIGFSMWGTNVGPSMLIASASAGFTTGIVSGNYAWYAFVFICLLAFVFAPRYLGSRITTLPEFMGKRFGQSTRNILAWYTIITILISWLALTLFAGGVLIRQVFDIPMWQSALLLLVISAFFTMLGGLKAVAYTNVYQMILLIVVSATLAIMGIYKVGGVGALVDAVPADYAKRQGALDESKSEFQRITGIFSIQMMTRLFLGYLLSWVILLWEFGFGVRISRWCNRFLLPGI